MYLSRLQFRTQEQLYEIHRTIMRAFGDDLSYERVLFRVENDVTVVQSQNIPKWNAIATRLMSCRVIDLVLDFEPGQDLSFSLLANPTVKRNSRRHGLHSEIEQRAWVERKAAVAGFEITTLDIARRGIVRTEKRGHVMSLLAVLFSGTLLVKDVERLRDCVLSGVGSGKGIGFGLLLLRRVENSIDKPGLNVIQ